MIGELLKIAGQCDGVRCDMAMLVLPDVFERTWGRRRRSSGRTQRSECASGSRASASWPRCTGTSNGRCSSRGSTTPTTSGSTTGCARDTRGRCASTSTPGSTTRTSSPASWRTTTSPGPPRRSARTCTRPPPSSRILSPGLRFFHQGQFEGRKKRISPHLVRAPMEPADETLAQFYERLLAVLAAAGRSRWPVAPARLRAGLGRQLDVGLLHRVVLAGRRRSAATDRRQLCREPEPVLRPPPVSRTGRPRGAAEGPGGSRQLRSRRR